MADQITPGAPIDSPMPFDDFEPFPPRWPKVVGGVSVGMASLGLICNTCMFAMSRFGASLMPPDPSGAPAPPWVHPTPLVYIQGGISLALSLLLMAAGLTTLGRKSVGRTLHLIWSVLGICGATFGFFVQAKMNASIHQWALDNPQSPIAQSMLKGPGQNIGQICGYVIGAVLGFGWPLFCLIWFAAVKRKHEQMLRGPDTLV